MPLYCVELYDKDNDVYDIVAYSSEEKILRRHAVLLEVLVKQDKIVRHCSDGTKEPYDTVHVRMLKPQEQLDNTKMYLTT